MENELRRARNRQMVIFLLVCVVLVILVAKLYYWQIIDGPALAQAASAEHMQDQTLAAPRGLIYSADGFLLATNVVRDDVYVDPTELVADNPLTYDEERNLLASRLHQVLTDKSQTILLQALSSGGDAVRVAESISPAQSQQLQNLHLPYVFLQARTWRYYPAGDLAAQVLGFVQEGANGLVAGIYGIEQQYNQQLAGKPGSLAAETDLNGDPLTVGASTYQQAVNGANLTLTLDSSIQSIAQNDLAQAVQSLHAKSGAVIAINVKTGAIVTMAGYPSFNPDSYGLYASQKGCLNQMEVYINPALYCTYEPGSTMKAVTMAAALDQHLITPDETMQDSGYLTFPDGTQTVTNLGDKAYGTESMTQVLEHSANVGAAWVAYYKLGAGRFYPYLKSFGFGRQTGLTSAEPAGYYRVPADADWSESDLARQSFGQSIQVSPLQMIMAYQALADEGVLMKPYLVSSVRENDQVTTASPMEQRRVVSATTATAVTSMLEQTATYNRILVPGYSVAAKTGTATTQGLATTETEASIIGYLPASDPQYVLLVKLDQPQTDIYGASAAPLWETIAQQLMWHYGVPPDMP